MTLTIDFTSTEETRLAEAARREGLAQIEIVKHLVMRHLPVYENEENTENAAAIALLRGWLRDEATDDPAEIRKAQEELDEFKRNLNANRKITGERLLFPE